MRALSVFCFLAFGLLPPALFAQQFAVSPCPESNGEHHWFGSRESVCELRRATLPLEGGQVRVQGENGTLAVVGEDRRDLLLEARVNTSAASREEAENLQHRVQILTHGTIQAKGPEGGSWFGGGWAVSFTLHVPRQIVVGSFETSNGSVSLEDVAGRLDIGSNNGALSLRFVSGEVHAHTTNGGISIQLAGNRLQGAGLEARTTNGGISVKAPANLSAHLQAETTNGGIHVEYPNVPQAENGSLEADLGRGGAPLRLHTTNGGIHVMTN